ncbi:MAG: DUF4388 domain-containing protein [Syntrophaceae bacterium]|nr:DUF4388 domain-containing protein [Syntrophaceae bacterium]
MNRWPICGLPVGSFLQVISMDQQTCVLEVYQNADRQGRFCFVQGALFDAVCNGLEGEDAALEMVSWENVRLNIRQIIDAGGFVRKIDKSLMSILMEYSRRRDEAEEKRAGEEAEEAEAEDEGGEGHTFKKCLRILRENMGDALVSASISDLRDGKVLASHHDRKTLETAQLFINLTGSLRKAFERDPDRKQLGGHYILNLRDERTLMVLLFGDHQLGILFNHARCSLGLVWKAVIPKVSGIFETGDL